MAASAQLARPAIAICTLLTAALTLGMIALAAKADDTAAAVSDVVVIGGTPGGVAAAVVAARLGHSVTLVAFSAIRMEPTWMALGQAAGIAAHLAIAGGTEIRRVPIADLQRILREQGAVLDPPE